MKILEKGVVPDDWALSIYRPRYKKRENKDPNNYKSISLASCLCKLFNSLVTQRIQKELENRKLLGQEQAGLMENASAVVTTLWSYTL